MMCSYSRCQSISQAFSMKLGTAALRILLQNMIYSANSQNQQPHSSKKSPKFLNFIGILIKIRIFGFEVKFFHSLQLIEAAVSTRTDERETLITKLSVNMPKWRIIASKVSNLNYKHSIEMEISLSKWRSHHQSTKNIVQTPNAMIERFRSSSKDFSNSDAISRSRGSIGNLLISPATKNRISSQPYPKEYYEMVNKENNRKTNDCLREPQFLKKELGKLCESRPQDKPLIDSTLALLHNYEQKIKFLQDQLQKTQKTACKKHSPSNQAQLNSQESKDLGSKKSFGTEKTVASFASIKKITDAKSICALNHGFTVESASK